jgi:hypothetical protein
VEEGNHEKQYNVNERYGRVGVGRRAVSGEDLQRGNH